MRPNRLWTHWWRTLCRRVQARPAIPARLWDKTWSSLPLLHQLSTQEQQRLQALAAAFLADKEFHGAQGLPIRDDMALSIALQACLPLLHWGPRALQWYDDFVGIVVHPDEVQAQREVQDGTGVVHRYTEVLIGEAMAGGPVMLAWARVRAAASEAGAGRNLVIHEFAHKLDLHGKAHDQTADGCPRLPSGFMGWQRAADARRHWHDTLHSAYEAFRRSVQMAERFGASPPWLDAYGATSPAEFFAVACEAHFTQPETLARDFPALAEMLKAFFHPSGGVADRPST